MNIKVYNPNKNIIPTELHLIVDDKYHVTYERDYDVKSKHHIAYIFTISLDNTLLKIDDIQQIMNEIGQTLIKQSKLTEKEWDLHDFEILKVDKHLCKYKIIFYQN